MKMFRTAIHAFFKIRSRVAATMTLALTSLMIPSLAHAKLSDWIVNIGQEFKLAVPVVVAILGALGVMLAGIGIWSAIMAKKNRQPLEYQGWFVGGGVLLILLIPLVIGLGASISGTDATNTLNGFMEQ